MAHLVKTFIVAIAIMGFLYGTSVEGLSCYSCKNCTEVEDSHKTNCSSTDTGCYITGNPEKEDWTRGCGVSKEKACPNADSDTYACSFCTDEDNCNSGNFLVGSILLSMGVVAILRFLH